MKNKIKNSLYVCAICLFSIIGLSNLNAQQSLEPGGDTGNCPDCQYKKKDVACLRAGFENGEPYVYIGDKVKCVDGIGSCTSSSCTQSNN